MEFEVFKKNFSDKLRSLRNEKKISAREMSLALGQNVNYINYIENGRHLPSMQGFFSICEYLDLQPAEFFSKQKETPCDDAENLEVLTNLSQRQLKSVISMIKEFVAL